jgi:hypothetical protein
VGLKLLSYPRALVYLVCAGEGLLNLSVRQFCELLVLVSPAEFRTLGVLNFFSLNFRFKGFSLFAIAASIA